MKRAILTAAAATALMTWGGAAVAVDADKFSAWDTNDNGRISQQEWRNGQEKFDEFSYMDKNGDGVISSDEYSNAYWDEYDATKDGSMDQDEFDSYRSGPNFTFPGNSNRKGS